MKVPFVGGSYEMDSVSFDLQRSINMYPLVSEAQGSKSVSALRGTAGYTEFASVGTGAIRGLFSSTSDRLFCVSGDGFYEVLADGTSTLHGTINTQIGRVVIVENIHQILVVDGQEGWIFTKATDAFVQVTSPNFPVTSSVTYQDGYFLAIKDDSQDFYISNINDGLTWDALDFTAVESSPDNLNAIIADNSNIWLFGNRSVEVYQNTGAADFPFERIAGAVIQTGCAAKYSVAKFDNTVVWLGVDEQGQGIVWKAEGYQARRISTQAIESRIAESPDYTQSFSWVYHEQGHIFYVLQIFGLDTTLVYDGSTGLWHERSYNNALLGRKEQHRGNNQAFFDQKVLIGDRENEKIYHLSLEYQSDNGDEQVRERIAPHYQDEKRYVTYSSFELDMEVGRGLNEGQGSDPQIMLQYSNDGGFTWSSELWRDIGKLGNYKTRVIWRRLGRGRDRVFRIKISDPVFVQINEAYINSGA